MNKSTSHNAGQQTATLILPKKIVMVKFKPGTSEIERSRLKAEIARKISAGLVKSQSALSPASKLVTERSKQRPRREKYPFASGAGSILDFGDDLNRNLYTHTKLSSDYTNVKQDWKAVGCDAGLAFQKISRQKLYKASNSVQARLASKKAK